MIERERATHYLQQFIGEESAGFTGLPYVWLALRRRGKLLSARDGFAWGMVPVLIGAAVEAETAVSFALSAAVECLMAALDILDDIEDGDGDDALWHVCGIPTATNVATMLLFLSQRAIARVEGCGLAAGHPGTIGGALSAACIRACMGQQRDLDQDNSGTMDDAGYLAVIADKSASLVGEICRVAAVIGHDQTHIEAYASFGFNLGMAMQIRNDMVGVSSEEESRNDLRTGKRTLATLFATDCAVPSLRDEAARLLHPSRGDLAPSDVHRLRRILDSSGALHYSSVVADVYWERALDCLDRIGAIRTAGICALVDMLHAARPEEEM
ncbi:MAG: polyprenyl synthetase family protein [Chloroflexota bacterium]